MNAIVLAINYSRCRVRLATLQTNYGVFSASLVGPESIDVGDECSIEFALGGPPTIVTDRQFVATSTCRVFDAGDSCLLHRVR